MTPVLPCCRCGCIPKIIKHNSIARIECQVCKSKGLISYCENESIETCIKIWNESNTMIPKSIVTDVLNNNLNLSVIEYFSNYYRSYFGLVSKLGYGLFVDKLGNIIPSIQSHDITIKSYLGLDYDMMTNDPNYEKYLSDFIKVADYYDLLVIEFFEKFSDKQISALLNYLSTNKIKRSRYLIVSKYVCEELNSDQELWSYLIQFSYLMNYGNKATGLRVLLSLGLNTLPYWVLKIEDCTEDKIDEVIRSLELRTSKKFGEFSIAIRSSLTNNAPGLAPTYLKVDRFDEVINSVNSIKDFAKSNEYNEYIIQTKMQNSLSIIFQVMVDYSNQYGSGLVTVHKDSINGYYSESTECLKLVNGQDSNNILEYSSTKWFDQFKSDLMKLRDYYGTDIVVEFSVTNNTPIYLQVHKYISNKVNSILLSNNIVSTGLGVSGGLITGKLVLDLSKFDLYRKKYDKLIIYLDDLDPINLKYLFECDGVISKSGNRLCHISLMSISLKKSCIIKIQNLSKSNNSLIIGGKVFNELDEISIDGSRGLIYE